MTSGSAFNERHSARRRQHATIHQQGRSGYERSPLAGQERNGVGHFFGSADSPQGVGPGAGFDDFIRFGSQPG